VYWELLLATGSFVAHGINRFPLALLAPPVCAPQRWQLSKPGMIPKCIGALKFGSIQSTEFCTEGRKPYSLSTYRPWPMKHPARKRRLGKSHDLWGLCSNSQSWQQTTYSKEAALEAVLSACHGLGSVIIGNEPQRMGPPTTTLFLSESPSDHPHLHNLLQMSPSQTLGLFHVFRSTE
jgi:hypothetical protein